MFILNFLRYIQGYVKFQASGDFVERFLNLVAREHISIWDAHKRGNTYSGCVRASSYSKLRLLARKAGIRLRIQTKNGAPFKRYKYRKRIGLLAGAIVFFAFLAIMGGFIWRIEINGNVKLEEHEVLEALDKIGVSSGIWRSSLNVRETERLALLEMKDISWIALNVDGSTIHVEISESVKPPLMVDPNKPCNIVASHSGQIVSMRVYEGQPLLREGDTVMAGEVIISGITQDRLNQNLYKHALADIKAQTQEVLTIEIPLNQIEYVETGSTIKRNFLQIFSLDLPIFWPKNIPSPYRIERNTKEFNIIDYNLPIKILNEEYILMKGNPIKISEFEAKEKAELELKVLEEVVLSDAKILDKSVIAKLNGNVFVLEAKYNCIMQIGIEKQILQ